MCQQVNKSISDPIGSPKIRRTTPGNSQVASPGPICYRSPSRTPNNTNIGDSETNLVNDEYHLSKNSTPIVRHTRSGRPITKPSKYIDFEM